MEKGKVNYKLIDVVLTLIIIFLIINTFGFWAGILKKVFSIILPFIIAFAIAYALYPFVEKLTKRKVPKSLAVFIVIAAVVGFLTFIIALMVPIVIEQLTSLFNWLMEFVLKISNDYNVDLNSIQEHIGDFKTVISNYGKSIGDFSFSVIMHSINILTLFVICFITCIYFLADMEKIRKKIKSFLRRHNKRTYRYVERLDHEVSQYFVGLEKNIIIQFIEYTMIFFLIGHPYYLLLGILCSVTTIVPYFGGIFANIIAAITAFFVSQKLFILTLIVAFICPNIDGYIISPRVYGKTNNVPGLLTIFAVFAGGKLAGALGIIIALPVTIILLATYRFYEDDIAQKLDDMKNKKNDLENG